ncbi:DUF1827 family protein [Vagococcus coleopterorum]|uniref:DUF1827 family protein n=1 Tax=Vagococcus coleopterorum TaxID=2714946 RepID=A0A6G8AKZ4_9ENTE|nr:DUF1827 family protein [Vagococcus coleopterorum]QIL45632.1 DUF1827 family protein [Vagococcus coleopterorum]
MKLIDVTNSYADLVNQQLNNTDATFVKVYTLGKSSVVYTEAPDHKEILIRNRDRNISPTELEIVLKRLVKNSEDQKLMDKIEIPGAIEISIPIKQNVSSAM